MNRLFDEIRKRFMPGTPKLSQFVRELVIRQNGITVPAPKPEFIEDEMDVDIGEFNVPLEVCKSFRGDDFKIESIDIPKENDLLKL